MKLTKAQIRALNCFADGHYRSAYAARCRLDTLDALHRKGLLSRRASAGTFTFPRVSIEWAVTPAGRQALASKGGER